ncbi:MAG: hypothetical protein SNJ57_09905 [Cyanobacteriota bacterium]
MNSNTSSNTLFPNQKTDRKPSLWQQLKLWIRQDIVADDPWDVNTYFPEEDPSEALYTEALHKGTVENTKEL